MSTATARIGPNAITRVGEALTHQLGPGIAAELFSLAGLSAYRETPPQQMVDEAEARTLHGLLRSELGVQVAAEVAREAGVATAEYLLAHRIPKPVQTLLRVLPAPWACRLLLSAIHRHAWTFVGSGRFAALPEQPMLLTIRDNPLCRNERSAVPVCDYYAATFEHLFRRLVHPKARVRELTCEACGDDACRFELSWSGPASAT